MLSTESEEEIKETITSNVVAYPILYKHREMIGEVFLRYLEEFTRTRDNEGNENYALKNRTGENVAVMSKSSTEQKERKKIHYVIRVPSFFH